MQLPSHLSIINDWGSISLRHSIDRFQQCTTLTHAISTQPPLLQDRQMHFIFNFACISFLFKIGWFWDFRNVGYTCSKEGYYSPVRCYESEPRNPFPLFSLILRLAREGLGCMHILHCPACKAVNISSQ